MPLGRARLIFRSLGTCRPPRACSPEARQGWRSRPRSGSLPRTASARGNIAIAQYIHGDGFDPHRFDVVTKMLGLDGRLHHKPSELSGGEQQRVAIARAIINEPKILLADEPTGNLDTKNSEIVLAMLRQLNKDLGQTVVMITHNPEAASYFDRIVHMRDGVIVDGVSAD